MCFLSASVHLQMNRFYIRLQVTVVALVMLGAACINAQNPDHYNYVRLTPEQGYPSSVNSIMLDDVGYALICSRNGVCRINNGSYSYLSSKSEAPHDLPGDYVYKSAKDMQGNTWILTNGGVVGLKAREPFRMEQRIREVLPGSVAFSVLASKDAVYFGGENIIWKYDYDSGFFSKVAVFQTDSPFNITEMLWEYDRVLLFSTSQKGVYVFYPDRGTVEPLVFEEQSNLTAALMTSDSHLWVAHSGSGISCYDSRHNLVQRYTTDNSELGSNHVLCLMEKDGEVWAGTYGGGLSIIDPHTQKVETFRQKEEFLYKFPDNYISALACDSYGYVWVGTCYNGAFVMKPDDVLSFVSFRDIRPEVSPGGVSVLYYDEDSDSFWAGFKGSGIMQFFRDGTYTQYPATQGLTVCDICDYGKDYLSFSCTPSGMYILNTKSGTLDKVPKRDFQTDLHLYGREGTSLCNDDQGRVIGIIDSIFRKDPDPNGPIEAWQLPSCVNGRVNEVYGSDGQFFIDNKTVYRWDEDNPNRIVPIYTFQTSNIIRSASITPDRKIWLGCSEGLAIFDTSDFSMEMTDLVFDSSPQSVLYDRFKKQVFIGTNDYLYLYFVENGNLAKIDKSYGVEENMYEPNAKFLTSDGDVMMGGLSGLVYFSPQRFQRSHRQPELVVDKVSVNRQPVEYFADLSLDAYTTNFDVYFMVNDTRMLRAKQFKFIIDGPKPAGRKEFYKDIPEFHFLSGLPAGHYVISGSCTAIDGRWTETRELYSFDVKERWYRTWLFRASVIVFGLILLLFILYRIVVNLRNRMEMERSRKMIEKFSSRYESTYIVNLKKDTYSVMSRAKERDKIKLSGGKFSEYMEGFISNWCFPDDREMMRYEIQPTTIMEHLNESENYAVKFRDMSSGSPRWTMMRVFNFNEHRSQVLVGFADRDEYIRNEEELEQARRNSLMEKERYNFLINVAHELRTPLTLILGPVKRILRDPDLDDKFTSPLTGVQRQADRMTILLNTVLTTHKIQEGAMTVRKKPTDMKLWLNELVDEFRDEAGAHDMNLVFRHDEQIGTTEIDPDMCHIVFANLMSNAIRHNEPGHHITVITELTEGGRMVRVSVRDHGSGIGIAVDSDKLFERYYQATEEVTGFGIGLSYAKTIIEAHGGRIGAFNNEFHGATFWFELPYKTGNR